MYSLKWKSEQGRTNVVDPLSRNPAFTPGAGVTAVAIVCAAPGIQAVSAKASRVRSIPGACLSVVDGSVYKVSIVGQSRLDCPKKGSRRCHRREKLSSGLLMCDRVAYNLILCSGMHYDRMSSI
jgi:hypothetical protein